MNTFRLSKKIAANGLAGVIIKRRRSRGFCWNELKNIVKELGNKVGGAGVFVLERQRTASVHRGDRHGT